MKVATGSHTGTGLWLMQRATALLLVLALPFLLMYGLLALPLDFDGWQALWAPLWSRVLLVLSGATLALHAWVGMRDIFMDYVHCTLLKLTMTLTVMTVLAGSLVWLIAILFGSNTGSGA